MNSREIKAMMANIAPVIRDFVGEQVTPLVARLSALETRLDAALPVDKGGESGLVILTLSSDQSYVKSAKANDRGGTDTLIDFIDSRVANGVVGPVTAVGNSIEQIGQDTIKSFAEIRAEFDAIRPAVDQIPEAIAAEVARALDALPKPEPVVTVDPVEVAENFSKINSAIGKISKEYATHSQVDAYVATEIASAVSALPKPADPIPEEVILAAVGDAVVRHLTENPPKDGDPGLSVDAAEVEAWISADIAKAVASLPVPKDGIGLAGCLINREGELVVTMTNGQVQSLGRVVGTDGKSVDAEVVDRMITDHIARAVAEIPKPKDGTDGKDGFSLTDFDVTTKDDGRTLTFSFSSGDLHYEVDINNPVMKYRGVFKEGTTYQLGDTVSFGGHLWHCDAETTEKPGEFGASAKCWTLAVRRGREGKAGDPAPAPIIPKPVKLDGEKPDATPHA